MHCDIPRSAGGRPAIAEDGRWLGSLRDELQALLAEHAWDYAAALGVGQKFIAGHLGDPQAILVLDETAKLKKGRMRWGGSLLWRKNAS